ncbi:MAG: serine/threonine protein kinase [Planctomycetaceae bacterium]|nr:serine/threonine protein kinase [Planctomycetaceae bacterium]
MEKEPLDDSIGQKAVEVGLITAAQLADVLLELSRPGSGSPDVGAALVHKGLLSAAQLDVLSGAPLKRLGKYVIVRELGRGGMGVVYEAEDSELDRRVALKMLLGSLHGDAQEAALEEERFIREARLSANLPKHPQIIGVYEAGMLEGRRFIAMEFIEGRQFSEWRRQGSITLRQQITVLRDTAMAVDHAHRHGIIHRDLKPANILVDRKNHPHVADFGLAKRTNQNATLSITASGMVMGTPAYMSPEQANGDKDIDQRSDLWALGVMLYEILTGKVPFDGDSPVKILMKTVNEPVPPPSTILRGPSAMMDAAIEAICMKALAKDPKQRYASARAFAEDLGRWLRGERVAVLQGSRPAIKPAWLASAAAAAFLIAGGVWFALGPSAEEQAAERAREFVVQGRRLMKQGRYSDAIVRFGQALGEDERNREAAAGKKEAEEHLVAAARPTPPAAPDSAKVRETIARELSDLDATLKALRDAESFGAARDLLTQSARRRSDEEWTGGIARRLEALRIEVDQAFGTAKAKAIDARKANDAAAVDVLKARVSRWKWSGLSEELDLELAKARPAPPVAPAPASTELPPPAGVRETATLRGSQNALNAMAFSSDGRLLVTTSFDKAVRIWDLDARIERARVPEPFSGRSVAVSPDGRWIAGGAIEGELQIWNASTLQKRVMSSAESQYMGVAFTPDSQTLVSSSVDGSLRTWDVETGLLKREMKGHPRGALGLSLSPDGRFAAVGTGEPLMKVWELATGKEVRKFENAGRHSILCVSYAPDGRNVAFGGDEAALMVGDTTTGIFRVLGFCPKAIRAIAWSPDGRSIATGSVDNLLRFWDPTTGKAGGFPVENGYFSLAWSPKGDRLAAGGADWTLRLFEVSPARK